MLNIVNLVESESGLRFHDKDDGDAGKVKAFLIGEIPYDSIVAVNWEGDEYYSFPHIYCYFNHQGQPYARLVYCEKNEMGHGIIHYSDIAEYDEIKDNSGMK